MVEPKLVARGYALDTLLQIRQVIRINAETSKHKEGPGGISRPISRVVEVVDPHGQNTSRRPYAII